MKAYNKGLFAYTVVSVLSMSLVVACGQTKNGAPVRSSKVSAKQAATPAEAAAANQTNLRYQLNVSDQKPLIAVMQSTMGDAVKSVMSNPKANGNLQENVALDLTLKNLTGGTTGNPGDGSIMKLKAVLNNGVDQPIVLLMASKVAVAEIKADESGRTLMKLTFTFLPDHGMENSILTMILDGHIDSNYVSASTKNFVGTLALKGDSDASVIGNFTIPLNEIATADDAAQLGGGLSDKKASDAAKADPTADAAAPTGDTSPSDSAAPAAAAASTTATSTAAPSSSDDATAKSSADETTSTTAPAQAKADFSGVTSSVATTGSATLLDTK